MWHWIMWVFGALAAMVLLIALTIAIGIAYHNYKVRRGKG